jgi:hypothetical protein
MTATKSAKLQFAMSSKMRTQIAGSSGWLTRTPTRSEGLSARFL